MAHLLFDTNILIDAALPTRPESDEACEAMRICNNGSGNMGFVTPNSLSDAYYVLQRYMSEEEARNAIVRFMGMLIIAPLSAEHCDMSVHGSEPDFEDGLIRAAAELEDIDFILTRDKAAFQKSKVRSVTAAEYLEIAG